MISPQTIKIGSAFSLAAMTLAGALCTALSAQAPSQAVPASKGVVPLTAGTCANVTDGQIVTMEWNPAFERPAQVTGMRRFELAFAPVQARPLRGEPLLLRLTAAPRMHGELPGQPDSEIQPGANGSFLLRFRVHVGSHEAGQYQLYRAEAQAAVEPGYQGDAPQMTNDPLRFPFCLNVIAPPARRRG